MLVNSPDWQNDFLRIGFAVMIIFCAIWMLIEEIKEILKKQKKQNGVEKNE